MPLFLFRSYSDLMSTKDALTPLFAVLKDTGGYFVFPDEDGNEFVVISRQDFTARQKAPISEIQLPLPPAASAVDVLDRINREIALYQMLQEEAEPVEEQDDLALDAQEEEPGLRVRFEPLKGDLSPELQE